MSELNNKSFSQMIDVLDFSSEINTQNISHAPRHNKIITINGVFSNQAETWYTLATNLGFMVYRTIPTALELVKECNYRQFEVR